MKIMPIANPHSTAGPSGHRKTAPGFTLLEVLLALAIAGFVLAAAATLLVSVSNIWTNRQDRHFFQEHVDGVTEYLRASFQEAGVTVQVAPDSASTREPTTAVNPDLVDGEVSISINRAVPRESTGKPQPKSTVAGLVSVAEEPIAWKRPPGFAAYRDPLLGFTLSRQPPLLVNLENAPALGVEAFLYFTEADGLSLLWFSTLQEAVEDERDLRRTMLSPFVRSIEYVYWDERFERWETEDEPREGPGESLLLPRYLKLQFEHEGIIDERLIAIPVVSRNALLF